EEAIFHAQAAGRADEAQWLYNQVLGGLRHLAWKLGEMARGLRILRSFQPCPERWDLAWYLRALGEFDEARACCELPYFQADILLMQGRLPEVAAVGDSTRTPVAAFLMGMTKELPPDQLAGAIPRQQILLYLGRLDRVWPATHLENLYHEIGWEGDRARCQLLLAEAARRQGDEAKCGQYLDAASVWILHSGSVEHLCLLHLIRSRFARLRNEQTFWQRQMPPTEAEHGLRLAAQCGLGLCHIELLCEHAEIMLHNGNPPEAEQAAREALRRASAPECQFMWGAAHAGHLVGQALCLQGRIHEARDFLREALHLRCRIGDPGAHATEHLLLMLAR
ncbi:MAG: hypothetical protein L0099_08440, partial [Acidobacteria bacterium]|nr:hypothetical protein [Acidobacteriota bacterium]